MRIMLRRRHRDRERALNAAGFFSVWIRPVSMIVLSCLVMTVLGCKEKEPIEIGFVGCLTGRLSDLGISGRDGAQLAVEEVNRAGGIKGRPIDLICKDDRHDAETALKADRELIDRGVTAIIGHMTSAMSAAVLSLINEEKVLTISPTASANSLNGIDDYFIRVTPPNRSETDYLARVARHKLHLEKISVVYDLSNRVYSKEFFENFKEEFENNNGQIVLAYPFTSGIDDDLKGIAQKLLEPGPDGVLLIAGALDAAIIGQHIRKKAPQTLLLSSGWAMTADFLQHGGPPVEGVIFSQLVVKESRNEVYLDFKQKFEDRFGYSPNFAAARAYEAARLLIMALEKNDSPENLKKNILERGRFFGVQGEFTIDRFGDPQRNRYLISVVDGEYKTLE